MSTELPVPSPEPPPLPRGTRRVGLVLAVLALAASAWGLVSRFEAQAALRAEAGAAGVADVSVINPAAGSDRNELVLPGSLSAWSDAPIYARTSGYLKRWTVDIGSRVKTGELLAEIDAPELDQQIRQAQADVVTAEANSELAKRTAARWKELLAEGAVARQDADVNISDAAAKAAALDSARANLQGLQAQQAFERILAPFDGVVTARNTDVGALITAGATSGQELFRVQATDRLRVYLQVPEAWAGEVHAGEHAELHLTEHPERSIAAQVINTADALDPGTRTLQVQLAVDNRDGALLPGAYVEAHFKLTTPVGVLRVPSNTLLFRGAEIEVAAVGSDNRVKLKQVTIGRDLGSEVEIVSGLDAADRLIANPPDSVETGDRVRVAALPAHPGSAP